MGVARDYVSGAAELLDVGGTSEVHTRAGMDAAWQDLAHGWNKVLEYYPSPAAFRTPVLTDPSLVTDFLELGLKSFTDLSLWRRGFRFWTLLASLKYAVAAVGLVFLQNDLNWPAALSVLSSVLLLAIADDVVGSKVAKAERFPASKEGEAHLRRLLRLIEEMESRDDTGRQHGRA